jgi:hypothetical protein
MNQDALYAMRYDPDGLAQGAYDARLERYISKRLARSPAIDAGSDDAWGYDTTSTHPKVIDMGQPDIGYHYYRRVADDDPIMNPANPQEGNPDRDISISFRQPPILKDGLAISYYRVGDAAYDPLHTSYPIADFQASSYQGQDVIEASIVNQQNNRLDFPKKYDLEARTYVDDNTWSAPSVFTVIVQPNDP